PLVFTGGRRDSVCVTPLVEAAGVLVQGVAEAAARGGGAGRGATVGRVKNAGATPARNIAATRINGHRLTFTAASQSSVGLTGVWSIAPSPLNASPARRGFAWRENGTARREPTCCGNAGTFLFGGR